MSETARTTDTLEQLADQLDHLARSATDWRHSDELVDGLQHVLRSIDVLDRSNAPGAAASPIRPSVPYPVAAHVSWYDNAPDDAPRLDSDVEWNPDFVQIQEPEHVTLLADWGPSLATTGQLPTDRVIRPEFPGAGWMVFQQGNRVLHRATPLLEPWRRCTYVPSFIAHHPAIDDPDVLGTLVTIDGPIAAPVEYARHRCHVSARRLREAADLPDEAARRDALRRRRTDLGTVLDGLLDPAPAPFVDYG